MDIAEKAAIEKYKTYQLKVSSKGSLNSLALQDFDPDSYEGIDTIDALKLYLDQSKKYVKVLKNAADYREEHYRQFIKPIKGKEEEEGHKVWRLGMNRLAKEAEDKYLKWKKTHENLLEKLIKKNKNVSNIPTDKKKKSRKRSKPKESNQLIVIKRTEKKKNKTVKDFEEEYSQTVVIDKLEELFQDAYDELQIYEDVIAEINEPITKLYAKDILDNFKLYPEDTLWDIIPQFYSEFSEDCILGTDEELQKLCKYYFSIFQFYGSDKFKEIDDGEINLIHITDWKILSSCKRMALAFMEEFVKRHFEKVISINNPGRFVELAFEYCICRFSVSELKEIMIPMVCKYTNIDLEVEKFIDLMLISTYLDGWYDIAIDVMGYFTRTCGCTKPRCVLDKKARCILYMRNKKSCFYEPKDLDIIRKTYRTYADPFYMNDYNNYYRRIIKFLRK